MKSIKFYRLPVGAPFFYGGMPYIKVGQDLGLPLMNGQQIVIPVTEMIEAPKKLVLKGKGGSSVTLDW